MDFGTRQSGSSGCIQELYCILGLLITWFIFGL